MSPESLDFWMRMKIMFYAPNIVRIVVLTVSRHSTNILWYFKWCVLMVMRWLCYYINWLQRMSPEDQSCLLWYGAESEVSSSFDDSREDRQQISKAEVQA